MCYRISQIESQPKDELRATLTHVLETCPEEADLIRAIRNQLARFALGEIDDGGFPAVLRDEQDSLPF